MLNILHQTRKTVKTDNLWETKNVTINLFVKQKYTKLHKGNCRQREFLLENPGIPALEKNSSYASEVQQTVSCSYRLSAVQNFQIMSACTCPD